MDSKGVVTGVGAAFVLFWAASFTKDISDTTWQGVEFSKEPVQVALEDGNYEAIETSVTTGYYRFRNPLQAISILSSLGGLGAAWYAWQAIERPTPTRKKNKPSAKPAPAKVAAPVQSIAPQAEKPPEPIATPVTVIQEPLAKLAREDEEELEADVWEETEDEEDDRPGLLDRVVQVFAAPSEDLVPTLDRLTGRYEWLKDVVTKSRLTIVAGKPGTGKSSFLCGLTGARATLPEKPHRLAIVDLHFRYGQYAPCIQRDFNNPQLDDEMQPLPGYPWIKHWGGGAKLVNGNVRGLSNDEQVEDVLKGISHFIETVEQRYQMAQVLPLEECHFRDDPITYLFDEVADLNNLLIGAGNKEGLDTKCQYENTKIRKANVFSVVSSQGITKFHLAIKDSFYDSYLNAATCIELIANTSGEERPTGRALLRVAGGKEREVDVPLWFFVHDEPVNYKRFFPDLV